MTDDRAAPPPAPNTPADASSTSQALKLLNDAVSDRSALVRRMHATYLAVAAYVAVSVCSTTDADLLRGATLKLPVLDVELPLTSFYVVTPLLLLALHGSLLVHMALLSSTLERLSGHVRNLPEQARADWWEAFPPLFGQLTGDEPPPSPVRWSIRRGLWGTVCVLPVAMQLAVQARFLAYHSAWVSAWQACLVCTTLIVLWVYWPIICHQEAWWQPVWDRIRVVPAGREGEAEAALRVARAVGPLVPFGELATLILRVALTKGIPRPRYNGAFVAFLLALTVALSSFGLALGAKVVPGLLGTRPDSETRSLKGWVFRATCLDARDEVLVMEGASELTDVSVAGPPAIGSDLGKVKGIGLHGRDLRGADLTHARLVRAEVSKCNLTGARLARADIRCSQLEGVCLVRADLSDCVADGITVTDTNLDDANLTSARLRQATMVPKSARHAEFTAADFSGAILFSGKPLPDSSPSAANLTYANLADANLAGLVAEGADANDQEHFANLRGADLSRAKLYGADLKGCDLQGANLERADLQGARLVDAHLTLASLRGASLWGANLSGADLRGADLREAKLGGIRDPKGTAEWEYADLRKATFDLARKADWDAVEREVQDVEPEARRKDALQRIAVARQRTTTDVNSNTKHRARVIYDQPGPFPGWLKSPPYAEIAKGLVGLATDGDLGNRLRERAKALQGTYMKDGQALEDALRGAGAAASAPPRTVTGGPAHPSASSSTRTKNQSAEREPSP